MAEAEARVALVTGGASGIGAAAVDLLVERGHRVAALDVAAGPVPSGTVDDRGVLRLTCDVTDFAEVTRCVDSVVQEFGRLHVVVNAAGILTRGGILDVDVADFRRTVDVNLLGTFHVIRAAAPHLRDAGWGRVVNVASIAGVTRVGAGSPAYGSTKAAVIGLTRDLTAELGAWGVTVNAVAPGAVETPMVSGNPSWNDAMTAASPLHRICTAAEFARVIAFLVSEDAAYITGTTLVADGGMTSGIPITYRPTQDPTREAAPTP